MKQLMISNQVWINVFPPSITGAVRKEGIYGLNQGCGSVSGLGPDSMTLWIRIRIGNPDPDRGAKKSRNFSRKMHF
jgi:hypothetical protein